MAKESRPSSGRRSRTKESKDFSPSVVFSFSQELQVYIEDIPKHSVDDEFEQFIKERVEITQRLKIDSIKYYKKLGIIVLQLKSEEDKVHLLNNVQSMVLDPKTATTISFVGQIELNTYIVVGQDVSNIPSADGIAIHYMQSYKKLEPPICQSISVQFPNIFWIALSTLDELDEVANTPDFRIGNGFATFYPRADCSFFEDLPPNTHNEKLLSAIATQINEKHISSTSIYAQYDKETSNAVVLVTKSNKKWAMQSCITIDGKNISKKIKLSYRVKVSPVPSDFDIDSILKHPLFESRVIRYSHLRDYLIIELDSMKHYEECLTFGALGLKKCKPMSIEPHSVTSDPDSTELDANNWYDTEMHDINPDILPFMENRHHPIFRYQWNSKYWVEQFQKLETPDKRSQKFNRDRHLLRVTVMLNTVGILRKKKYVVDGEEIALKLQRLQTILYDHRSKLFQSKTIPQTELKTPYSSTSVIVTNDDCLVLYEKLVKDGHRPLLLNMANATSPGGGYRKGDGAQEENIFRRSDYYHSLDLEIADKDGSERFYCTPKYEVKRPHGFFSLYPMEEFGAIYTSGITVFRGTELDGYPLMKDPLYNVCSIAMAAYREPKLTKTNMLENKFATNTHKKIQNIFAIGYHQKHDCLVLSALGCGAFRNPPEHIAYLFKSVIYQYAGYFDKIYFAIIDDHNTGNRINPRGNFLPFKEILDGLIVHPPKTILVNGVIGPYQILAKSTDGKITVSDACIQHLPPCHHATRCREIKDTKHTNEFSHPPICLHQDSMSACSQMDDEVHMFTFFHRMKCKHGGECTLTNLDHLNNFDHPEFCKKKSDCTDSSPEHLHAYRHLPACPDGITCLKYLKGISEHINAFRHFKTICPYDNCCPNFHVREHIENTIHSFKSPCPFTPYNCSMFMQYVLADGKAVPDNVENHCLRYSHVCLFGRLCKTTQDTHFARSIHIARQICPDLDKCSRLTDETHLECFSHQGIRDIRLFCRHPGYKCPDRSKEKHLKTYRHANDFNQLGVAPSRDLNAPVDFFRNQGNIIKTVNSYVDASGWVKAKVSDDILNWIRALQPAHRCGPQIFASILIHGHVMSRDYMSELIKPRCVVNAVMQHSEIRSIFRQHNAPIVKENTMKLIELIVKSELFKAGSVEVASLDADHDHQINIIQLQLKPPLDNNELDIIQKRTAKIVAASIELSTHLAGIGFDVDKKLGTDKHVFSILGPHCGTYYGDIVITFKQELMFHPDANFSYQAGTSFYSSRVYTMRPWLKDPGNEAQHIEDFHRAKLHCSFPRYENAAAAELIAATGKDKNSIDINLQTVIKKWNQVDSHFVFEGHLPPLIPLDYIENVYMPKNLFASLPDETQVSARKIFEDSLVLFDHDVDLTLIKPGATTPFDDTRKPYLKFILDQLSLKIDERIKNPRILRGFVITIPSTRFKKHVVLPMTITQSHRLYCLNKSSSSNHMESTYIYWQAMDGDMMLTLTNEKLDPTGKSQPNLRCLVCYVARKPSTNNENYFEEYSYLNNGSPYHHSNNVHSGKFKAKSQRFYCGCNTDDFFTFCLKITHKTGEVSLRQAGSNGIYNHENINYQFQKADLDLLKLDYIHISAGNHDVPIRNLMITHEPVEELHPTFDKEFTIDTSHLVRKRRESFQYIGSRVSDNRASDDRASDGKAGGERKKDGNSSGSSSMKRAASLTNLAMKPVDSVPQPQPQKVSRGFLSRLKYLFLGTTKTDEPPQSKPPPSEMAKGDDLEHEVPPYNPSPNPKRSDPNPRKETDSSSKRSEPIIARKPPLKSSTLPPCRDSIYCLLQKDKDHINKYSHPCRFNDLCLKQSSEPHLVHQEHNSPTCLEDNLCSRLSDPLHRAQYRHTGLPDYLIPCDFQELCYDKDQKHRTRFFHGEEIPSIKSMFSFFSYVHFFINKYQFLIDIEHCTPRPKLIPCRFGSGCRNIKDPQHTARFSHPSS